MKRLAIDMDEVVADAYGRFFEWYERDYGIRIDPASTYGKRAHEVVAPEHREIVRNYPFQPGFFVDLPVMEGAVEVIRELNERFEVFFVSAAMQFKHSLFEKSEWLDQHFPFIKWPYRVFCGYKYIIDADYLIDDHVFNLKTFKGQGILYTSPHNVHQNGYPRVNNWAEVKAYFDNIE